MTSNQCIVCKVKEGVFMVSVQGKTIGPFCSEECLSKMVLCNKCKQIHSTNESC